MRKASIARKDCAGIVILKQDDVIGVMRPPLLHARRADRHARHSKSACLGPLQKQSPNVGGRHVPFDDVTINHSGMAGLQFDRNANFFLYAAKIHGVTDVDGKTGGFQMPDPLSAAAAVWILVDRDLRSFGILLANKERQSPSQRNSASNQSEKRGSSSYESLHDLRFDTFEEVDQFGEFFALLHMSSAPQRFLDSASGMCLEDFALDRGKRSLHCLNLVQDIHAVPVRLNHANEAARLTLDTFQAIGDGGATFVLH